MQWVMKKRSYWEFGELLNPGVKTLIYATDPKRGSVYMIHVLDEREYEFNKSNYLHENALKLSSHSDCVGIEIRFGYLPVNIMHVGLIMTYRYQVYVNG